MCGLQEIYTMELSKSKLEEKFCKKDKEAGEGCDVSFVDLDENCSEKFKRSFRRLCFSKAGHHNFVSLFLQSGLDTLSAINAISDLI